MPPLGDEPETLSQIEQAVNSPHLAVPGSSDTGKSDNMASEESAIDTTQESAQTEEPHINDARDAVQAAISSSPDTQPLEPVQSLNAQPVFDKMDNDPLAQSNEDPQSTFPPTPTVLPPSSQSFVSPQGSPVPPQDNFSDPSQPNPLNSFNMPIPQQPLQPFSNSSPDNNIVSPNAPAPDGTDDPPPPVPPPMMPPVV
jgi:hypothetical protein